MRRFVWLILAFALLLVVGSCGKAHIGAPSPVPAADSVVTASRLPSPENNFGATGYTPGIDYMPDQFVVGFKRELKMPTVDGGNPSPMVDYNPNSRLYQNAAQASLARAIRDRYSLQLVQEAYARNVNFAAFRLPDGGDAADMMRRIWDDYRDDIEYVQYDGIAHLCYVPDDPDYPGNLWGMVKIKAEDAWDTEKGDPDVRVGVIDTGIRYSGNDPDSVPDHEDLADNTLNPPDYWPDEKLDLFEDDNIPDDHHGHGSHVSGTIAAVGDNSKGVVGVAYQVSVVPIRIFGPSGGCPDSRVAQAITLADAIEVDIVSMSIGGTFHCKAVEDACNQANDDGILLVAAAANDNTDRPSYPGFYPVVLCVGATTSSDHRASFSNYGQWVDIAAPGVSIKSCGCSSTHAYMSWQGTSMACPHVSGAAALLLSHDPSLTNDEIRAMLESSGPLLPEAQWGNPDIHRLDVDAALDVDLGDVPSVSFVDPTDGETVSGAKTVEVNASDPDGSILKVFLYVGTDLIGVDDEAPYTFEWDTTHYVNGDNALAAEAWDNQYQAAQEEITVNVDNDLPELTYRNDFEGDNAGWWTDNLNGPGYWQLVDDNSNSPTHSYHFGGGGGGQYGNLEFDFLVSPVFDLHNLTGAKLRFSHQYQFEKNYDYGYVVINDGSGHFENNIIGYFTGTKSSWEEKTLSLNSFLGKYIQVRFFVESDRGTGGDGWWVDDFKLVKKADPPSITITAPTSGSDVSGTCDYTADVSSDNEITQVEFWVEDEQLTTDTEEPYATTWTTTDWHGGSTQLTVKAWDEYPTEGDKSETVYVKNHEVSGFDVDSGVTGSTITVEGTYFIADNGDAYDSATDHVYFSGVSGQAEAAVLDWQKEAIQVEVPADAVTGPVTVNINGASVDSPTDFTVLPHIDSLDPDKQIVGANITIHGTGFGVSQNDDSLVQIGSTTVPDIVSWANDQIEIEIPPDVAQAALVVAVTAGTSNGVLFTPVPHITGLSRDRGWVGYRIDITGTSFGDEQGDSTVTFFNGVPVGSGDLISWSETQISVKVPDEAETGDITVTVYGEDSDGVPFTVILPPPVLGGLSQY